MNSEIKIDFDVHYHNPHAQVDYNPHAQLDYNPHAQVDYNPHADVDYEFMFHNSNINSIREVYG